MLNVCSSWSEALLNDAAPELWALCWNIAAPQLVLLDWNKWDEIPDLGGLGNDMTSNEAAAAAAMAHSRDLESSEELLEKVARTVDEYPNMPLVILTGFQDQASRWLRSMHCIR